MSRHIALKISPAPSLPSGPEALWAGGQRGGIPPFCKAPPPVGRGEKEGLNLLFLNSYGLTNNFRLFIMALAMISGVAEMSTLKPSFGSSRVSN